jgi:hypothetical protein
MLESDPITRGLHFAKDKHGGKGGGKQEKKITVL